eukprot:177857_1
MRYSWLFKLLICVSLSFAQTAFAGKHGTNKRDQKCAECIKTNCTESIDDDVNMSGHVKFLKSKCYGSYGPCNGTAYNTIHADTEINNIDQMHLHAMCVENDCCVWDDTLSAPIAGEYFKFKKELSEMVNIISLNEFERTSESDKLINIIYGGDANKMDHKRHRRKEKAYNYTEQDCECSGCFESYSLDEVDCDNEMDWEKTDFEIDFYDEKGNRFGEFESDMDCCGEYCCVKWETDSDSDCLETWKCGWFGCKVKADYYNW